MKQANIVLPPPKKCVVCETLTDAPYGRTAYHDFLCSRKCFHSWDQLSWEERRKLHQSRK